MFSHYDGVVLALIRLVWRYYQATAADWENKSSDVWGHITSLRQKLKEFHPHCKQYFLHGHVFCLEGDVQKLDEWLEIYEDEDIKLEQMGLELMNYMHKEHSYRKRAESIVEFAEMQGLLDED